MIKALADAYRRREAAQPPIFGPVPSDGMASAYILAGFNAVLAIVIIAAIVAVLT